MSMQNKVFTSQVEGGIFATPGPIIKLNNEDKDERTRIATTML